MDIKRQYLPSTRFIAYAIIGVGIVVAFFLLKYSPFSRSPAEYTVVVSGTTQLQSENDTDGDGLRDWEEVLWGTNPQNTDTDGDGTSDGDEVLENRHPAIKGPNDSLGTTISFDQSTLPAKPDTYTAAFSRELLAQYLEKKKNNTLYLQGPDAFFNSVFSEVEQGPGVYVITDLSFGATNNDVRRNFANALMETIVAIDPFSINTSGGPEELAPLGPRFAEAAQTALGISVPNDIAITYLDTVNALSAIGTHLSAISIITSDPVGGLAAMKKYEQGINELAESLHTIGVYLQEKQVVFGDNDAGLALLEGL